MARDRFHKQSLGSLYNLIKESCVLLVGAGGIGCELLKNLVLTGYNEIHIIDLDTIDLSNLNRQFLFRHEHIKKPKATVAKEAAQKFNPNVKLVSYHADIKDAQFDVQWFSQFTLVFNALDNLDARRHVNKMCLAADIPLIESGTTGFNGQVQVIKKGRTACYDCTPKIIPKTFAVCTIRSTPSQPIHTIVWAKSYLLPELFGSSQDETPDLDASTDADNSEEIEKLKEEAKALQNMAREEMGSNDFARRVFDKVFKEDIERLASMEDMWKQRKSPIPLSYETLKSESQSISPLVSQNSQQVWTTPETFIVFAESLARLSKRLNEDAANALQVGAPKAMITFDKDDEDTLDFVTAAANLRSTVFGIQPKSKFDTKQMAGNIIPAIATTNAMVASLCVMQAFKVMREKYARSKMIFLDRGSMSASSVDPPNPDCPVCSMLMARLRVDLQRATLSDLVDAVLKKQLDYEGEIALMHGSDLIFDQDLEDNLEKQLSALNVKNGSFLLVKDESDDPRVDVQFLVEVTKPEDEMENPVELVTAADGKKLEIPKQPPKSDANALSGADAEPEITQNGTSVLPVLSSKRKREADGDDDISSAAAMPVKKLQAGPSGKANDAIVLDEDEGAIEID